MSTALLDVHASAPGFSAGRRRRAAGARRHRAAARARAQIVGLLGRSGSGKSTLLRLIAGLVAADRGDHHLSRPAGDRPGARHRDGVPELRALSLADRAGKRAARARGARAARSGNPPARARGDRPDRARRLRIPPIRASFPAACASASALPARSSSIPTFC